MCRLSTLKDAACEELDANARCTGERRIRDAHLTGPTDPRGTEVYNLALGDLRAQSAMEYFEFPGVEGRIGRSSVGEETARGTGEPGRAPDRRVEFEER